MLKFPPAPEGESASGLIIPEHDLLRCIGRGSYGQVWLARNRMGVYRAVKVVFRSSFDSEKPFARELSGIRKFEPVSRLHEGFIDVLQVGINAEEGYFYYVMELGDDQALGQDIHPASYVPNTLGAEIARRGSLSAQECLQLGLAMTHALAELHNHGLVHRDIKPSNVIFVNGKPKLADIGLVAHLDETRSFVGTEGFVPPEGPGTVPADLFSLGKVLYEASTGKDRNDFPELPAEWTERPDYEALLELNEILLQACASDARQRYQTAWDMHAELLVIVNGKSVKRLRLLEKRLARVKRVAAISAALLLLSGLVAFQIYQQVRSAAEERRRQVAANLNYGTRAMESGDLLGALPSFAEALRLDAGDLDRERTHRVRLGSTLAQCPKVFKMWFLEKQVNAAEFSPDGRTVLLAQYYGPAEVHDLNTGELLWSVPFTNQGLHSAVYNRDGRYILFTTDAKDAIVWDANSRTEILRLSHPDKVFMGGFSPDSTRIVTGCSDGLARVWDMRTGKFLFYLGEKNRKVVSCVAYSHDGQLIGVGTHDFTARIYHAGDGHPASPVLHHGGEWVYSVAFSPDDTRFLTTCGDRKARVWDTAGNRILPDLAHSDAVVGGEYSPDGRMIATVSWDTTLRLWRASDLQPIPSNPVMRQRDRANCVVFSSDARSVLTGCTDGTVALWDLAGAEVIPPESRGRFAQDGCHFLCSSNDFVEVFEAQEEGRQHLLSHVLLSPARVQEAQLTPAGDLALISAQRIDGENTNCVFQVRHTSSGELLGPEILAPKHFGGPALSSDGMLLAASSTNLVRVWNTHSGTRMGEDLEHEGTVIFSSFVPATDKLVVSSSANAVYVWSLKSGRMAFPPLHFPVPVVFAGFNSDARLMVTCCSDPFATRCYAQVWDLNTGQAVTGPLRHSDGVLSAAFSPDSRYVATASEDFTARIWDARTGTPIGLPLRHSDQVHAVAFSPDGAWVATGSADHTARVWDTITGDPITPPLRQWIFPNELRFTRDLRHLLTGKNTISYDWPLPRVESPVADLVELSEFFSGGNLVGVSAPYEPKEPPERTWQRLRKKIPTRFTVTREEIWRWHDFVVRECESDKDWKAAVFHLEEMQKMQPGNQVLAERLENEKHRLND